MARVVDSFLPCSITCLLRIQRFGNCLAVPRLCKFKICLREGLLETSSNCADRHCDESFWKSLRIAPHDLDDVKVSTVNEIFLLLMKLVNRYPRILTLERFDFLLS